MTVKVLKILYSNISDFISGEQIAAHCGISRAAVKKHIDKLCAAGYKIEAVKKAGYRLMPPLAYDGFSLRMFLDSAGQEDISSAFFDSIVSTNIEAKKMYTTGGSGVVVAAQQTAGKGRSNRGFFSPCGGVYLSYYSKLKTDLPVFGVGKLTALAAVAANRVCHQFGIESAIKWPNDILYGGKKLCGILSETITSAERLDFLVMGVGINVNTKVFDKSVADVAVSFGQITGKEYCLPRVAAALVAHISGLMQEFYAGRFEHILAEYRSHCLTLGKKVTITGEQGIFTAHATDQNANLIVTDSYGNQKTVYYGDVSVKL